jgi:hypothetical protein
MDGAMFAALDPYRRIRATVALLFLVAVAALATASLLWARHATHSSVSTAAASSVQTAR